MSFLSTLLKSYNRVVFFITFWLLVVVCFIIAQSTRVKAACSAPVSSCFQPRVCSGDQSNYGSWQGLPPIPAECGDVIYYTTNAGTGLNGRHLFPGSSFTLSKPAGYGEYGIYGLWFEAHDFESNGGVTLYGYDKNGKLIYTDNTWQHNILTSGHPCWECCTTISEYACSDTKGEDDCFNNSSGCWCPHPGDCNEAMDWLVDSNSRLPQDCYDRCKNRVWKNYKCTCPVWDGCDPNVDPSMPWAGKAKSCAGLPEPAANYREECLSVGPNPVNGCTSDDYKDWPCALSHMGHSIDLGSMYGEITSVKFVGNDEPVSIRTVVWAMCAPPEPPSIQSITASGVCYDPITDTWPNWSGNDSQVIFTVEYKSPESAGATSFTSAGIQIGDSLRMVCNDLSTSKPAGCTQEGSGASITAKNLSRSGSIMTIEWWVTFEGMEGLDIPISAYVYSSSRGSSGWQEVTTWNLDSAKPNAAIGVDLGASQITWVGNDNSGNIKSGFRDAKIMIVKKLGLVVLEEEISGVAELNRTDTFSDLGLIAGEYVAELEVWDNACRYSKDTKDILVTGGGASGWLMTDWGDAFAEGGYSNIKMGSTSGEVLGVRFPPAGGSNAFSRYIISAQDTILTTNPSRRTYELTSYDDQNTKKFPPDGYVYDYLMNIADTAAIAEWNANDWTLVQEGINSYKSSGAYDGSLTIPLGAVCDKVAVIFVEGDLVVPLGFSISEADKGCLFIVKGDITAGDGSVSESSGESILAKANEDIDIFGSTEDFVLSFEKSNFQDAEISKSDKSRGTSFGKFIHAYLDTDSIYRVISKNKSLATEQAFSNLPETRVLGPTGPAVAGASSDYAGDPEIVRVELVGKTDYLAGDTAVVVGSDNNPVIAYSNILLYVIKCNNRDCTDLTENEVTPEVEVEGADSPAMAIGADGTPVIAYFGYLPASQEKRLRLVKCGDPLCSSGNTFQTIGPTIGALVHDWSRPKSIAIGTDGNPIISYYDIIDERFKIVKCSDPSCSGSRIVSTPLGSASVGANSIVMGDDGLPFIAYISDTKVFAMKCNDSACSGQDETISEVQGATAGYTTGRLSATLDIDGNPMIGYSRSNSTKGAYIAKCLNSACTSSTVEKWASEIVGMSRVLVGDGIDGSDILVFTDHTSASAIAKVLPTGGSTIRTVDLLSESYPTYMSMVVDSVGNLFLVSAEGDDHRLVLTRVKFIPDVVPPPPPPDGGGSGIDYIDGFFVTDGTFSTTECGGTFVIKGGVLAVATSFNCPGDGSNPGEIIDYDSRYLYILKDYLGEGYPCKIREWKYTGE